MEKADMIFYMIGFENEHECKPECWGVVYDFTNGFYYGDYYDGNNEDGEGGGYGTISRDNR